MSAARLYHTAMDAVLTATYRFLILALALLFWGWQPAAELTPVTTGGQYYIQSGSRLYLRGSSNVVNFTCECECYSPSQPNPFQLVTGESPATISFQNTQIRFLTRSLDCGQRGINSDMYETLKADRHPSASIEVLRVQIPAGRVGASSAQVQAVTAITIAGIRRQEHITVSFHATGNNQYRIYGSKPLSMAQFGLVPPSPMGGLIKVNDRIDIYFDLNIKAVY